MRLFSFISAAVLSNLAVAQQPGGQINSPEALASPGTGSYGAHFFEESSLPKYVIYQPKEIPTGFKAPLLIWGNGGCLNVGTIMAPFLLQVASQGVVVIVTGPKEDPSKGGTFASFGTYGQARPKALTDAIDWAESKASDPKWAHLDLSRVAVGGQSCGGTMAYAVEGDKRIKTLGIFNSGNFPNFGGFGGKGSLDGGKGMLMVQSDVTKFTKPIFYFLGGPSDIAYANGKRDYGELPAGLPAFSSNWPPTGHGGTYNQLNGGVYGIAASHWVNWVLRGNATSASWFTGDGAKNSGWTEVESKNLDKIKIPSPI